MKKSTLKLTTLYIIFTRLPLFPIKKNKDGIPQNGLFRFWVLFLIYFLIGISLKVFQPLWVQQSWVSMQPWWRLWPAEGWDWAAGFLVACWPGASSTLFWWNLQPWPEDMVHVLKLHSSTFTMLRHSVKPDRKQTFLIFIVFLECLVWLCKLSNQHPPVYTQLSISLTSYLMKKYIKDS